MHTAVVQSSLSEDCRRNARCREGREDATDDATSDPPTTARTGEKVEAVCRQLIDDVASASERLQNIQTSTRMRFAQLWSKVQGRERCTQDLCFTH